MVGSRKYFPYLIACALLQSASGCVYANPIAKPKATAVVVSWYGKQFHGRTMACGETFDMYDESVVAHKTLPCGTKVLLTNPENGKSISVIVQDRGPKPKGRAFDLSYGAAKKLQIIKEGVAKLLVTIVHS